MKKKPLVGIIDTKTSNIKSVFYALSLQDVDIKYIADGNSSSAIDAMIVPGIGNFSFVMDKLKESKLDKYISSNIEKKYQVYLYVLACKFFLQKALS